VTQGLLIDVAPHAGNPDPNQRYTTRHALAWCKAMAGVDYDLDAAACLESHHAPVWYGLDHPRVDHRDGLRAPWFGHVFCNPAWDDVEPWVEKAWDSFACVVPVPLSVSMLLPGDRTHRPWWQRWVEPFRDQCWFCIPELRVPEGLSHIASYCRPRLAVHYPPERFAYGGPGNPEGIGAPEPNFTSVLLIWRCT
jgi:hypothetical protein